jgi:hypothetical protein
MTTLAEKKRRALRERRFAREKRIEESLHIWENEIIPDWKVVNTKPSLRRLWWNGIPSKLRASMWERAVGNALALSKGRNCNTQGLSLFFDLIATAGSDQIITEPVSPGRGAHCLAARSRRPSLV